MPSRPAALDRKALHRQMVHPLTLEQWRKLEKSGGWAHSKKKLYKVFSVTIFFELALCDDSFFWH
jgi:hypothetical protein